MKEIDTDGNVDSLKRHMDNVDKAEATEEACNAKLLEAVLPIIEEAESIFNDIQREFDITHQSFLEFVKEN